MTGAIAFSVQVFKPCYPPSSKPCTKFAAVRISP